jgi:hypothetical protein
MTTDNWKEIKAACEAALPYIPHIDPPISREFREGPQSALR